MRNGGKRGLRFHQAVPSALAADNLQGLVRKVDGLMTRRPQGAVLPCQFVDAMAPTNFVLTN